MSVIPIDQRQDAQLFRPTINLNSEDIKYFKSCHGDYKKKSREYEKEMTLLEEILMKASSELITGWVAEYIQESYQISLDSLEKLRHHRYFEISDSGNKYSEQTNQEIYASFIEQVKRRNEDCEDICLMMIATYEIDELIEKRVIRANGVTERRLKRCLGTLKSPKELPPIVIQAFCRVLGIDYESLNGVNPRRRKNQNKIAQESKDRRLSQILFKFNYEESINQIQATRPQRIGAFLLPLSADNLSHYWLSKRIKYEIETTSRQSKMDTRKAHFNLAGAIREVNCFQILSSLYEQLGTTKIDDVLTHSNLVIIFDNIDSRSPEELETIIKDFWYNLVRKALESRNRGFLLMLWTYTTRRNKQGQIIPFNPLFPQVQAKIKEDNLKKLIQLKPLTNPNTFSQQDFENIWLPLAEEFEEEAFIRTHNRETVLNLLWQDSQGDPRRTLEAFYRRFNLKLRSHLNLWEQWI